MKRIVKPEDAFNIFSQLYNDDIPKAANRNKVEGMVRGKKPFDPVIMKRTGQSHRTNTNYREGESIINARNTSFFELFLDNKTLIEMRLVDLHKYMGVGNFWENIVSSEITRALKKWDAFEFEMMVAINSMNTHGLGFVVFRNPIDWQFRAFKAGEVLLPDSTRANIKYIDTVAILDEMLPSELYAKAKKTEGKLGWQTDSVKKTIKTVNEGLNKGNTAYPNTDETLRLIFNGELANSQIDKVPVKIVHVLVREMESGKISHYILDRDNRENGFLYKNEDAYDDMADILVPFASSVGDGYYNGIKGIGHKVYPSVLINNRFLCRGVDGAMDSASLIVGFPSGTNREGKTVRLGNQIILPPGAQIQRHDLSQNIQGITNMYSLLTQVNQNSIGAKRPGLSVVSQDDASAKTARGATINATTEVQLEKVDVNIYYTHIDILYGKIVERMFRNSDELSKEFRRRCFERGVPPEALDVKLWEIKAPRAIGGGSAVMKSLTTQEMLGIAPYIPTEVGKMNLVKDFVEARGGLDAVERYFPPFEDELMPTRSRQIAQLENNDIEQGQNCLVSIEDYHPSHMGVHLDYFGGMFNQILQSQNPDQIVNAMQIGEIFSDHCQKHLAYMSSNDLLASEFAKAKEGFKQVSDILQKIMVFGRQIIAMQRRKQEARQKQLQDQLEEGQNAKIQLEREKIRTDAQLRLAKEQSNDGIRRIKAQHGMMLDEEKLKHEMALEDAKARGGVQ